MALEEEHGTQNQKLQIQFSALLPTSAVTSAKEATSRCFHTRRTPSNPKMLESSEQGKGLQKGLPGCQFEAELAVGGAEESVPVK